MIAALLLAALAASPAPPLRTTAPPPPAGNLAMLFSSDDYPKEARKARQQGTVGFRLHISREGRVSACTITASSGSPSLDAATCALVQRRARFRPARDRAGNPAEDFKDHAVTWVLP